MPDTAEQKRTTLRKEAVLTALELSLGIVTSACKEAEVPRRTFYQWCEDDKDFKAAVDDISEIALDYAESKLFKLIKSEVPSSVYFYLKTKGKKRGYIERQEIDAKFDNVDHGPWDEDSDPEKFLTENLG